MRILSGFAALALLGALSVNGQSVDGKALWRKSVQGRNNLAAGKVFSFSPAPSYRLTVDKKDINDLTDGKLVKRPPLELPERIEEVVKCRNPRCITSCEQELPHVFVLRDRARGEYRCLYCETKAQTKGH